MNTTAQPARSRVTRTFEVVATNYVGHQDTLGTYPTEAAALTAAAAARRNPATSDAVAVRAHRRNNRVILAVLRGQD